MYMFAALFCEVVIGCKLVTRWPGPAGKGLRLLQLGVIGGVLGDCVYLP